MKLEKRGQGSLDVPGRAADLAPASSVSTAHHLLGNITFLKEIGLLAIKAKIFSVS